MPTTGILEHSWKHKIYNDTTVQVIEKQWTGTGAIKRQIPLLKPKREINKYYK